MISSMGGTESYIFLHGISVPREIRLSEAITLLPATCKPFREDIGAWTKNEIDEGVILIFLPRVSSQMRIVARDDKTHAIIAWNSMWDALFLSAFTNREVSFNFQCNSRAEEISARSKINIINYAFRGLHSGEPHAVTESEADWLEARFKDVAALTNFPAFQNAIHAMWSFRWHTIPRIQLAVIWAGIEGLFKVDSELSFRISLYCSRFLEPTRDDERKELFQAIRKLYAARSKAVHGAELKGDVNLSVEESAKLLQRLIRQCVESKGLPDLNQLAP